VWQRVKKLPSKADLRARLERETERFLQEGGRVEEVPTGQSAREPGDEPARFTRRLFTEPPAKRTLVPEVVAAIEARRKTLFKRSPSPKRTRLPRPRRKIIYDDFGEPLRKVWVDD
jgi:hypothetical protein